MFPQREIHAAFRDWAEKGLGLFVHLFKVRGYDPKSFQELCKEYFIHERHFLHFRQTTGCWKLKHVNPRHFSEGNTMDRLIENKQYSISIIYNRLQTIYAKPLKEDACSNWYKDFMVEDINTLLNAENNNK